MVTMANVKLGTATASLVGRVSCVKRRRVTPDVNNMAPARMGSVSARRVGEESIAHWTNARVHALVMECAVRWLLAGGVNVSRDGPELIALSHWNSTAQIKWTMIRVNALSLYSGVSNLEMC